MTRVSATTELPLSTQEQRIARLLAWGMVQKEIADKLGIAPQTISVHLRNIYRKLAIHKETDLCRWWIFYEYGIADNPLKKIITICLLWLTCWMAFNEENALRTFRSRPLNPVTRTVRAAKPIRTSRSKKFYALKLQYC